MIMTNPNDLMGPISTTLVHGWLEKKGLQMTKS